MPSSGAPTPFHLPAEDSYLELLADTLDGLELPARAQFLQRYFHAIVNLDLSDTECLRLWDQILARRRELAERLDRPVALKTALLDVFSASGLLRVPIVIEYDELKHLRISAVTDPLTGLYNRRSFSESLEKELNRAKRYGHPFGLVILDLHKFKEVNDRHGHPRGDEVLRMAAATLRKALRTSDSAFRIGGDEFAVLLPQTEGSQANAFGRRISAVFEEALAPLRLLVDVGFDYGIATYPQDADEPQQLIQLADERLYHLKHSNHGRSSEQRAAEEPSHEPPREGTTLEIPLSAPSAAPPKPISIDSVRVEKAAEAPPTQPPAPPNDSVAETAVPLRPTMESAASASASAMSGSATPVSEAGPRTYAVQRKAERVSMSGTNAYAVLGENGTRRARVLDLGFGGVALEMDPTEIVAENTLAILHVPILPPVRVNLRPVWSQKTAQGTQRVGCAFVS